MSGEVIISFITRGMNIMNNIQQKMKSMHESERFSLMYKLQINVDAWNGKTLAETVYVYEVIQYEVYETNENIRRHLTHRHWFKRLRDDH